MECRPKVGFEGPEGWIRALICTSQAAIETKEMSFNLHTLQIVRLGGGFVHMFYFHP